MKTGNRGIRPATQRVRQLGRIEREVLQKLSFGDLLVGYLLSAGSTGRMFKLAQARAMDRYRRKLAVERLVKLEYIESRGERLTITKRGQSALGDAMYKTRELLDAKKSWDGKWRVAIFDIPEEYATLRNKMRRILKQAGFVKLQQSVWVFPHECAELVELIKQESELSEHILYGVLDNIEGGDRLRAVFGLK